MKIEVKYSRLGNLWNFVEVLTLWHFSYNEEDVRNWISWTGELSEEEKQALSKVRGIMEKYSSGWRLDQALMVNSENVALEKAGEIVEPGEIKLLEEVLRIFEPRFNKLWPDEETRLAERQRVLQTGFNSEGSAQAVEVLQNFFAPDQSPDKVEIFLLMNTKAGGMQGGANLGPGRITLHCSHSEPIDYARFAGALWHEIAHLFHQSKFRELEKEFVERVDKPTFWGERTFARENIIREAVVASLSHPMGYINERILGRNIPDWVKDRYGEKWEKLNPRSDHDWQDFAAYNLSRAVVPQYVESNKTIDREFMEELLKVWQEYLKLCEKLIAKLPQI